MMKLRTALKIIPAILVVLLCTGLVVSLYFRLNTTEKGETFDLYTVVPATAFTVVDTDDVTSMLQNIAEFQSTADGHVLYTSELFSSVKKHINALLDEAPHGLSRQMNKMVISYHEPGDEWNQVFYCRLGVGDSEFIQRFIQKSEASSFPAKQFNYKGEEIKIYSMANDRFLACYFGEGFLAVSFQKRLIEQVIDAQKEKKSLANDSVFAQVYQSRRASALPATLYVRENTILSAWTEFNIKMDNHAIYLSGINYGNEMEESTFINRLRYDSPLERFPGAKLPASTYFFSKRSASDLTNHFHTVPVKNSLTVFSFQMLDSLFTSATMAIIPAGNAFNLRKSLEDMNEVMPGRIDSIFSTLVGAKQVLSPTYYDFYLGDLLLATDSLALANYVQYIEDGYTLEKMGYISYGEGINSLSQNYHIMCMADMEFIFNTPEGYADFVPDFFYRHNSFFRHFILCAQLAVNENVIYPNLILYYKNMYDSTVAVD